MHKESSPSKTVFISESPEDTEEAGAQVGKNLQKGSIIALNAGLGAGKTVFARGVARSLGIKEQITSPTYTIINEYETKDGTAFFHVDAYRLSGSDDFEAIGGLEILSGIILIEWSSIIKDVLPSSAINVDIKILDDGKREISVDFSKL
jgi:tRNA threonylcarbamoyladenosine biosynthesis protein TsaE